MCLYRASSFPIQEYGVPNDILVRKLNSRIKVFDSYLSFLFDNQGLLISSQETSVSNLQNVSIEMLQGGEWVVFRSFTSEGVGNPARNSQSGSWAQPSDQNQNGDVLLNSHLHIDDPFPGEGDETHRVGSPMRPWRPQFSQSPSPNDFLAFLDASYSPPAWGCEHFQNMESVNREVNVLTASLHHFQLDSEKLSSYRHVIGLQTQTASSRRPSIHKLYSSRFNDFLNVSQQQSQVLYAIPDVIEWLLSDTIQRLNGTIDAQCYRANFFAIIELNLPYPTKYYHGDHQTQLIYGDDIFENMFTRAVLSSNMNAPKGFDSMNIGNILRYLILRKGVSSLVSSFLNNESNHLGGGLVDTLVRASIEENDYTVLPWLIELQQFSHLASNYSQDIFQLAIQFKDRTMVKKMLSFGLIDVDATIQIRGQIHRTYRNLFTALEFCAMERDIPLVKILLKAGAKIKGLVGPLDAFSRNLSNMDDEDEITGQSLNLKLVELLLDHGARVHVRHLSNIIAAVGAGQPLVRLLAHSIIRTDHRAMLDRDEKGEIFRRIAKRCGGQFAIDIVSEFLETCERERCGQCHTTRPPASDAAVLQAARDGVMSLVELLLCYSKTLPRLLTAAIESGDMKAISRVLEYDIDLTGQPHINAWMHRDSSWRYSRDFTEGSPLAAAIRTGNQELVTLFESRGALENLDKFARLEPLISAASHVDDEGYVFKLLQACPSADPMQLSRGLVYAIMHDNTVIFDALLDAGADVTLQCSFWVSRRGNHSMLSPIVAAIQKRNEYMVYRMLAADMHLSYDTYSAKTEERHRHSSSEKVLFVEAARLGSFPVLDKLHAVFPWFKMQQHFGQEERYASYDGGESEDGEDQIFQGILEHSDLPVIDYLVHHGIMESSALDDCLRRAIDQRDEMLAQHILDLGADPYKVLTNLELLVKALKKTPDMVQILWNNVLKGFVANSQEPNNARCRLILAAAAAIDVGDRCIGMVEAFLSSRFYEPVHLTSFIGGKYRGSLFGLAINSVKTGHYTTLTALENMLEAGADANSIVKENETPTRFNQTALLEAIDTGHEGLVALLIKWGANVNQEVGDGLKRTPLQKAAETGSLPIVKILIENGALVNAKPAYASGATALQFAAMTGNCAIAAELLFHGADINMPPSKVNGRWPIEGAAEHGRLDMVEYLWSVNDGGFPVSQCHRAMTLAKNNKHWACSTFVQKLAGLDSNT